MNILTVESTSFKSRVIKDQHLAQLAASGIPGDLAEEASLWSAEAAEVQRMLGRSQTVGSGLIIPYFEPITGNGLQVRLDGKENVVKFVRVRLDEPHLAPDRDGNPSKYLSRRGSGQHPYLLPRIASQIRAGTAKLILITEGEKKALSAISHGFCAVGISGNFGWKQKGKQTVLPSLEQHLPKDSIVALVWDSDAALNTSFAMSTRLLHENLRRRGVAMKTIVLPQAGVEKVGLDDFLVAHGAAAFQRLLEAAKPLPSDRAVSTDELIEEWTKSFTPVLSQLTAEDAEGLLKKSLRKGLVHAVSHELRQRVLEELKKTTPGDILAVFNAAIESFLDERHGPSWRGTNRPEKVSKKGTLADGTRVRVVADEDAWCWVTTRQARGATWPVPYAQVTFQAGVASDGKVTAAEMADVVLRLHHTLGGSLTLRHFRTVFFEWKDNSYHEIPDCDLFAKVMGFLRQKAPSFAHPDFRKSLIENMKAVGACHVPSHATPPCLLNDSYAPRSGMLSFSNGSLDIEALRRGEPDNLVWSTPTPLLFNLNGRNFPFEPKATCPKWFAFLEEVLPDPELRALVQELTGYCLLPDTSLQRFFLLYGPGANGKKVYSDVLTALVGKENVCSIPLSRFGERFALWPLTICLVNLVAELPAAEAGGSMRIAEDKLKAVVSGDPIEVERKNKDIIKAIPVARQVFTTNELPAFVDRSEGVWRRMIVVPFSTVISEEKRDPELAQKIMWDELPGIMNWAIAGLLRLLDRGRFVEPAACQALKAQHRLACAAEEEFLNEHVKEDPAAEFAYTDDLYAAYRNYVSTNGKHPFCCGKFIAAVQRVFPKAVADRGTLPGRKRGRGLYGLRFYPNGIPEETKT